VLEDTSKDPRLNYGFMLSFMSQGDSTRISSYSVGNTVDETVFSPPATPTTSGIRDPLSSEAKSPDEPATSSFLTQRTAGSARVLFAAFKALPIEDSAHYVHMGMEGDETDKLKAKSCQEVVEKIVEQIAQACSDHGNKTVPPIVRNDVVRCVSVLSLDFLCA
jgi:phosphatidylinositol 4-phosphatase